MSNEINVYKAGNAREPVITTTIIIGGHGSMDDFDRKSIGDTAIMMDRDAERIVDALVNSLPGGTLRRLFAKLADREARHCHLIIPVDHVK